MNKYHNYIDQFTVKIDDSLPYEYDDDGDLVYTGDEHEHPIPVKDIQSHIIKLQEQNRFTADYQVWLDSELKASKPWLTKTCFPMGVVLKKS